MDFKRKPSSRVAAAWTIWVIGSCLGLAFAGPLFIIYIVAGSVAMVPLCQADGQQMAYGMACLWPFYLPTIITGHIVAAIIVVAVMCGCVFLLGEAPEK